jgi:SulP family sulfate permease
VELRTVKAGKRIFKAGTECNELFMIRSGTVRLTVPLRKKDSYHLATCGPGELIGDMGFIESGSHAVDAQALTDTEVYMLERERFEFLSVEYSDLAIAIFGNVAHTLSARLRATIGELQALRG